MFDSNSRSSNFILKIGTSRSFLLSWAFIIELENTFFLFSTLKWPWKGYLYKELITSDTVGYDKTFLTCNVLLI